MHIRNLTYHFPEGIHFLNNKKKQYQKKENNSEPQTKPVTVPFKGKKNKQPHYKIK